MLGELISNLNANTNESASERRLLLLRNYRVRFMSLIWDIALENA